MKKIINPYVGTSEGLGYNCFACAPHNPCGLKMEFYEDGEEVVSFWTPDKNYQGWLNTLHGGIQATLMDETGGWLISRKFQTSAMTTNLNVKYKKPVPVEQSLEIRARLKEVKRSFLILEITLSANGEVCSVAEATYYKFSKEMAEKEFHFLPYEVEE
ncbi:MAG: PaaI family thioesterase [Bacteroidales bacterium]|nr:PaaI family thioesterase [Bacteroidales bacterium]MBQ3521872.1 PaaI family thioesterase [Bacteroidales bacterium]MBQ8034101.1 PaaI family thioesterase [Bacteroidales bacterium]